MAQALDQLQAGVPLNWSQIDDDDELATLARLQPLARQWRNSTTLGAPPELQEKVLAQLDSRLPQPTAVPVKEPPKALAGFSENVPVLTQVEDDIPSLTNARPVRLAAALAVLAVLGLLLWWAASVFLPSPVPTFTWIQVMQDGKPATNRSLPVGWQPLACRDSPLMNSNASLSFQDMPPDSVAAVGSAVGFPILSVPAFATNENAINDNEIGVQNLNSVALYSCRQLSLNTPDPGAIVQLKYNVRYQVTSAESTRVATGNTVVGPATAGRSVKAFDLTQLAVFEASRLPFSIPAARGSWKEESLKNAHGIYWRGPTYTDMSGELHVGDTSLLAVEDGDLLVVFIGRADQGLTEQTLLQIATTMDFPAPVNRASSTPTMAPIPTAASNSAPTPPILNSDNVRVRH